MRNSVLFSCENKSQLKMANILSETLSKKGIKTSLFWPHPLENALKLYQFDYITNDLLAIPGCLQSVGLVVFFVHETSPFCLSSVKIGYIAKKTNTHCITIQHGWIQPGLNFRSEMPIFGFNGRNIDSSRAIHHFSDVYTFFGDNSIGYPLIKYQQKDRLNTPQKDSNVLLTTNFNWGVFRNEDIICFVRSIMRAKEAFPSLTFKHRPHAAEKPFEIKSQVGLYLEDLGITQCELETIEQSIEWSNIVITTPSTVALESVSRLRPTLVFSSPLFDGLLSPFDSYTFSHPDQLEDLVRIVFNKKHLPAPEITAFKPDLFHKIVLRSFDLSGPYKLTEEEYIIFIKII